MIKSILLAISLLVSTSVFSEGSKEASTVLTWLGIVDSGSYTESWNQAAPYFQKQLSSSKWKRALSQIREPLGKVLSRKISKSSKHNVLPSVPEGEYITFSLATSFENKRIAIETVTVARVDLQWQVVGYYIK